MDRTTIPACLAAICFVGVVRACTAQASPGLTGPNATLCFVESINGGVQLMAKGAHRPALLDPARDRYHRLTPGDKVMALKGGSCELSLYGRLVPLKGPSGWYPAPNVPTSGLAAQIGALQTVTRIGGRERGGSIYSPSEGGAVRASEFVIRWLPQADTKAVMQIDISDVDGGEVAAVKDVPAAAGNLKSDALREALQKFKQTNSVAKLRLTMSSSDDSSDEVIFRVLSAAEEKQFDADLAWWNRQPGLLRVIGRATVFQRSGMYWDGAAELEAALALAPRSRALLEEVKAAEELAGDKARVRELTMQIKSD